LTNYTGRYTVFLMGGAEGNARSQLVAVATTLFASHGYEGVGVQQIVDAAKVTKPTLYHHFGSKLGLLEALLGEGLSELHHGVEHAAIYRHDLPVTLLEIAKVTFTFAKSHPELYRLHLSLWLSPVDSEAAPVAFRAHQRLYGAIETLFREAAIDHGNMKGRHQHYAATFLGMLNGYIALAVNGHAKLEPPLMRQAVHQFMHGIYS
jgi:TetR/AcrR family transcriptional regulator